MARQSASATLPLMVSQDGGSPPPGGRQLLGGWRLSGSAFARGAMAIDFATNRLWLTGHAQTTDVLLYNLPALGTGDYATWPLVPVAQTIPGWWPTFGQGSNMFANGLCWWRGKLWAAPKLWYDTAPPTHTDFVATDGETFTLPGVHRPRGAGFVKRGFNLDPLFGAGGYETSQGNSMGPTLFGPDGRSLIEYMPGNDDAWGTLPDSGGLEPSPLDTPVVEPPNWNMRPPRPANYYPRSVDLGTIHRHCWWAWQPLVIIGQEGNGPEGRWAADRVYGGGLVLPEGICYWAWMGTGVIDYRFQNYTFCADEPSLTRTYKYIYNPITFLFDRYEDTGEQNPVYGQELGPDGRAYLAKGYLHTDGYYSADVVVFCYGQG